eukprot:7311148-Heterocapsa_arctica.AAC.1
MVLITSPPQGPAVLERLITGSIRLFIGNEEIPIFPYTSERVPQAQMPVENDAAQRLYEATAAGSTAGPSGTAS